jgi:hypothetical protein
MYSLCSDVTPIRTLRRTIVWTALTVFSCVATAAPVEKSAEQAPLRPHRLRCEHVGNPLAIDEPRPRLSWALASPRRANGRALTQFSSHPHGKISTRVAAIFGTAARYSARAFVTGLGYYELCVNGYRIGDHCLDPGYTRYDERVLYVPHDITDSLRQGSNVVGVMLGSGWFNVSTAAPWNFNHAPWRASPRLLIELRIEMEDGRVEVISSDASWKTTEGPITYSCNYGGESYDARREQAGWNESGFDDSGWQAAVLVEPPGGRLVSQAMPAIEVSRELAPVDERMDAPEVAIQLGHVGIDGLAVRTAGAAAITPTVRRRRRA